MNIPDIPKKAERLYTAYLIIVAVVTLLLFAFVQVVNLSNSGQFFDLGWFQNNIGEISDEFSLTITPASFTFAIWGVIYIWQAAWIIYVLTSFCRRNQYGPVFRNPPIVTPYFLMVYCCNLLFNVLWLFLFDNKLQIWSFIALFLIVLTLDVALIQNHMQVDKYGEQLRKDHPKELWAIRILIQNGLMVYRAWTLVATSLNFGFVLQYEAEVEASVTSTIVLGILSFSIFLDFFLEVTVWDRYMRYTFVHWLVYIWALIGSLSENWQSDDRNSIMSLLLLFLCVIFLIVKIPVVVWRHRNRPLYVTTMKATTCQASA